MRTLLSHYRARIAWVLGVSGCCAAAAAACEPKSPTAGLLVAPTATATSGDAATVPVGDAGSDATGLAYRPLPEEPHGSRGQSCDRDVTCTSALDEAPVWPYPPPFGSCGTAPSGGRDGDGTFSQAETTDRRKVEADACCYVKLDCGGSRGVRRKNYAPVVPGRPGRGEAPDLTAAGKWTAMARMELTAVEAFLDYEADLRAHGAPQMLLDAARKAAKEEVSHARLCLLLATRDREDTSAARPPRHVPVGRASLDELVACTFLDGCVNEQLAAASLRAAAEGTSNEEEREILLRIAEDEQGHAELSWAVLRWALRAKAGAREALRAALATLRDRGAPIDDLLLDPESGASLAYGMLESVVMPAAYALIAA